jgi:uncharacterized protein (DUF934 family)
MPLLKGDRPVADPWRALAAEEPLPTSGPLLLPLARLEAEAAGLAGFAGELGVVVEPSDRVEALEPWLPRLSLVAVRFPAFGDGRGYSTARILRQRYRFAGEVRATGNVLVDQYQFLRQCGFDAFEVAEGRALAGWRKAAVAMSLAYQPEYAGPGAEAIWRARRSSRAIAAA